MSRSILQMEKEFVNYTKKITAYNEALALIYWDLRTGAPRQGTGQRAEVIGILSSEVYDLSVSEAMAAYIANLSSLEAQNIIAETTKTLIEECKKEYDYKRKIPAEEYKEYTILLSQAETVWEEAREKSDFALFKPYLEKIVTMTKRFITYWGSEGNKYNTLLDLYEPGMTTHVLDRVFSDLRASIVPLVQKIAAADNKPKTDFLFQTFPKTSQRAFSIEVLKQMGYNFEAGRLDETVHPFATGINRGDVRITTRYDESDFRMAVFGTIHEGGHALYEQNIREDLTGTPLCSGASMGIHESQSLFYENFVARDLSFWKKNYELLKQFTSGHFDHVPVEKFYRAINESKPSLIRIEADELTYPLHVMIRYEIEKGLFNDEIKVEDLPSVWNDKYEEYLGVRPSNDKEGVLQDVHWAGGSFGYFPSYALGLMYAAQFKQAMLVSLPNYAQLLEEGNLQPIKEWLTTRIHQFGKLKKPLQILQDATGEGLNAEYLIEYLTEKYSGIYQL
ncbi:carboxypeptidase M32 [Bacillus benzoevorans]|uniref:Metal-dependent carboxypeptidase n=1 Tax=Bacillus benzoevorans TaxID=1456 RepID=A0A7X0HS27_9BACI|nr:carboxypeptidase M32 [Bacillus benzoevorans]MBB6444650.1 carboxypeptidase Taq [Bacillus benzoevorans]